MLSLFYTGKGFFLFFWFSAVGHGFLLLIIEEGRGWERMAEEAGGGRRKQGRQRKIGKRGWLCALGAEHVAEQMVDGGDGVLGSNKEGA